MTTLCGRIVWTRMHELTTWSCSGMVKFVLIWQKNIVYYSKSPYSSVVEHSLRKRKVRGSIPRGGFIILIFVFWLLLYAFQVTVHNSNYIVISSSRTTLCMRCFLVYDFSFIHHGLCTIWFHNKSHTAVKSKYVQVYVKNLTQETRKYIEKYLNM